MSSRRSIVQWSLISILLIAGLLLSSCAAPTATPAPQPTAAPAAKATAAPAQPTASPAAPAGARTLTVSVWGGATEETVKKYAAPRLKALFPNVELVTDIGGQAARYNKVLAQKDSPTIDVFFASQDAVQAGLDAGLWEKVDTTKIPNLKNLYDWATPAPGYGAAYGLIAYGLAYNPKLVKVPPTSWLDLTRDDLKNNAVLPAIAHSQMPAFISFFAQAAGGKPDDINLAISKLVAIKPVKLSTFWTDWIALNKSGDALVAVEFDYYINVAKDQGYDIEFVIPKEGAIATIQHLTVIKGSKNKDLAEAFINIMLDPEVQQGVAKDIYNAPSNKTVKLDPALGKRLAAYGDTLAQVKSYDMKWAADIRAKWTEVLNEKAAPAWGAK